MPLERSPTPVAFETIQEHEAPAVVSEAQSPAPQPRSRSDAAGTADPTAGYKLFLDTPSRQPALGFEQTARALARIVIESDPQFAIAIFGGWGSGKTTLMQAIDGELDPRRVVSVHFNAWRYEKEQHLIVPLLDVIREALVVWSDENRSHSEAAKRTAATVGKATRSILAGLSLRVGLPNALELSFDANKALQARRELREDEVDARVPQSFYHASFRALSDAFAAFAGTDEIDRRIVVFVDDLDRCLPESALQVLEAMKLFFDLHGFVFVVGLDQEVVQQVIDLKYGPDAHPRERAGGETPRHVSGEEYLKKIFQLPYRLAPVAPGGLDDFLSAASAEARLPREQQDDLLERVRPHLRYFVGGTGVNPREVKRYVNAYTVQRRVNHELDSDVVLTLQTIASRPDWRRVNDTLSAYGPLFVQTLARQVEGFGQRNAVQELDPELALPDSFLEYIAPDGPGNAIVRRARDDTLVHADDIDRYVYRGEAARIPQDPALLNAIRSSGRASLLLAEAKENERGREALVKQASRALETGRLWTYMEFGGGSVVVRELLLHDWNAYWETEARLKDQTRDTAERARDLDELHRIARALSDRLLGIYRAGEAPWGAPE